ncbi:MAG: peptidyl-prolyl cis-trans isomerase [bacterium]|nr:MAG: peptidyl-prolyl cis-trans isomerase [bacterium]
MLKQMRERTKTILWIVVVAFVVSIFAVWGMNLRTGEEGQDPEIVGTIEGQNIYRRTYSNLFTELYNQMKMQRGEDYTLSESEYLMLAEQAWEMVIQKYLLSKELTRLNIIVTDNELVSFLRRNPHPSLQQVFTNEEGTFDYQAYLKALADPEADWSQLERWGRSILPELKFEAMLAAQVHIPEREVLEEFKKENVQIKASYIKMPVQTEEPPYEPTDDEIAQYYEEHKDDYTEPVMRQITAIEMKKEPTAADEAEALERLLEIREAILAGKDFAEAAQDESDDNLSAERGGDLGFFARGEMVEEFENVAFTLPAGELSEPVRSQYGYHLIRVEEKKTEDEVEKVHARHILIKVEPGYETIDSLASVLRDLRDAIQKEGFEQAAATFGLTIKEPSPFTRGAFIKDLGYLPRVINFTFNHKPGSISSAIETKDAIYFVKVLKEIPERAKPLEDVRLLLADRIRREHEVEGTRTIAEGIRKETVSGGDFSTVARAHGFEVQETPPFRRNDAIPGVGVNTTFAMAAHVLPAGELSPPIQERDYFYLLRVTERSEPDMNEYANRRVEILNRLRGERASRIMAGWYESVRKDVDVVDMRERTLD